MWLFPSQPRIKDKARSYEQALRGRRNFSERECRSRSRAYPATAQTADQGAGARTGHLSLASPGGLDARPIPGIRPAPDPCGAGDPGLRAEGGGMESGGAEALRILQERGPGQGSGRADQWSRSPRARAHQIAQAPVPAYHEGRGNGALQKGRHTGPGGHLQLAHLPGRNPAGSRHGLYRHHRAKAFRGGFEKTGKELPGLPEQGPGGYVADGNRAKTQVHESGNGQNPRSRLAQGGP